MRGLSADAASSASHIDSEEFAACLRDAATWGESGGSIELLETHISWVVLMRRFAYKIRKPVRYEFVDFSTLERRRADCVAEVELNQRLAPNVYLGVLPLTRDDDGTIRLDGKGEPIEWVVKMRRLAAADALDQRIVRQQVTPAEVTRLAMHLTAFYNRLPPLSLLTDDYLRRMEQNIRGNFTELLASPKDLDRNVVRRVHAAQLRMIRLYPELVENRVRDGRIVEGHGDLRPEHIYLTPAPVVIDCVEFRRDFREIDVLDELCFFAMECERLGAGYLGKQIVEHYCREAGDHPPQALLMLYRVYRACVRAKVHILRARQLTGDERATARGDAREYLQLADRYAARLGPPVLLLVRGRSGSGKSTLASALAETLALDYLATDVIRQELYGIATSSDQPGQGRYSPEHRQHVYDELTRRAETLLQDGVSVVVDGTFLTRRSRQPVLDAARRQHAVGLILECTCPLAVAQQRIAARRAAGPQPSDAWPELAAWQQEHEEDDPSDFPSCTIDTETELAEMITRVQTRLREEIESHHGSGAGRRL